jgi:tyrosyl-tRNA synthetase
MQASVARGELHPMQAKKDLAHSITADFHSKAEADSAAENWAKQFQQRGIAEDVPEVAISLTTEGLFSTDADSGTEPTLRIPKLLQLSGLAASTGEATRKLAENAVSINAEKFTGRTLSHAALGEQPTLRLGKKAVKIRWTP